MILEVNKKMTVGGIAAALGLIISLAAAPAVLYSRLTVVEAKQEVLERSIERDIEDIKDDVRYIRDRLDGID